MRLEATFYPFLLVTGVESLHGHGHGPEDMLANIAGNTYLIILLIKSNQLHPISQH